MEMALAWETHDVLRMGNLWFQPFEDLISKVMAGVSGRESFLRWDPCLIDPDLVKT